MSLKIIVGICTQIIRGIGVKELRECVEGRILEFYKKVTILYIPYVKYDDVKKRVCNKVAKVRGSTRFKRKDDFEKARILKNENLDSYAQRLEILARSMEIKV